MGNYLDSQVRILLFANDHDGQLHEWLCHPGEECKDGCDVKPIPERQAVYERVLEEYAWGID